MWVIKLILIPFIHELEQLHALARASLILGLCERMAVMLAAQLPKSIFLKLSLMLALAR
jgi:hypothetical protein